ncbi:MAG: plasmid mobilization relaxosome protein MobC [Pseudomonadota bacterium]
MSNAANDNESKTRIKVMSPYRVTEHERALIKANAKAAKLSVSEYQRRQCIDGHIIMQQDKHDAELIRQLLAIGNNLNQIAKKLHVTNRYHTPRLEGALLHLEKVLSELMT